MSAVDICNNALQKIGANRITTISDTGSKESKLCNDFYTHCRDTLLICHPWNFAIARDTLAQSTTVPEFEFTYAYIIPTDCLQILTVEANGDWQREENLIVSNSSTMKIKYIKQVTDTSKYPVFFTEALSYKLASILAYPITQSVNLKQAMLADFNQYLKEARGLDAKEGTSPSGISSDQWMNARLGSEESWL